MRSTVSRARLLAFVVPLLALLLVGSSRGAFASLNATARNATAVGATTGTLRLVMADAGVSFGQTISAMAPTDVVNTHITLMNNGTLKGRDLSLSVFATGDPVLLDDGSTTRALRVGVLSCPTPWATAAGTCSETPTVLMADTTVAALRTARVLLPAALAAGSNAYLQVRTSLPDQSETTTNGQAPAASVQNATAALVYTFSMGQSTTALVRVPASAWVISQGNATTADGSVTLGSGGSNMVSLKTNPASTDVEIDTTARLISGAGYAVFVRGSGMGTTAQAGLSLQYDRLIGNRFIVRIWNNGSECGSTLASANFPAGLDIFGNHRLHVSSKGDTLVVDLDGGRLINISSVTQAVRTTPCGMPTPTGTGVGLRNWGSSPTVFQDLTIAG